MDTVCPSLESLAAFLAGSPFEDRAVLEHLADCELYRATLALAIKLEDDAPIPDSCDGVLDDTTVEFQPQIIDK